MRLLLLLLYREMGSLAHSDIRGRLHMDGAQPGRQAPFGRVEG